MTSPRRMGRRGGTSANAGRIAVLYEAELPNGQVARKRSYRVDSQEALMGCYQHKGEWYVSGVTEVGTGWPGQTMVVAHRVW